MTTMVKYVTNGVLGTPRRAVLAASMLATVAALMLSGCNQSGNSLTGGQGGNDGASSPPIPSRPCLLTSQEAFKLLATDRDSRFDKQEAAGKDQCFYTVITKSGLKHVGQIGIFCDPQSTTADLIPPDATPLSDSVPGAYVKAGGTMVGAVAPNGCLVQVNTYTTDGTEINDPKKLAAALKQAYNRMS